jgi:hypothetical protein
MAINIEDLDIHDKLVSSFSFAPENRQFSLYLKDGEQDRKNGFFLSFYSVFDLTIDISWSNSVIDLSIEKITKTNPRKTPNGVLEDWDWTIEFNWPKPGGQISFSSTGFQILNSLPDSGALAL